MKEYLKSGQDILLSGESDGEHFKRTFHIIREIGSGGSVGCYEAYYENGEKGILKEFYPLDGYYLMRNQENNQVIVEEGFDGTIFDKAQEHYIHPYKVLLDIKRKEESPEIATFIPTFEIYYGCDEDCNII